jgi:hypothetical protein
MLPPIKVSSILRQDGVQTGVQNLQILAPNAFPGEEKGLLLEKFIFVLGKFKNASKNIENILDLFENTCIINLES